MFEQLLRELPTSGHKQVEALLASRDGGLWWGAGPALYQWKGDRLSAQHDSEPWLQGDRVTALCEDHDESLWVGTLNGQLRNLRQGRFVAFTNDFSQGPVTAIAQTPAGALWVGTLGGGLNCVRQGTNTILTTANGLFSNLIRTLFVDDAGVLWIGTLGGGLSRWQDGRIQTFTTAHGLVEDSVVQIMGDNANNLWLGGNHGLMRVSKRDLELLAAGKITRIHPWVLDSSDGMLSEQCVAGSPACLKTPEGKLFFATARGIAVFDEPGAPPVVARPRVRIEEVLADSQVLQSEFHGSSTDTLYVPAGTSRLTFRYTGLSFGAPNKVRFRCQLEGIDLEPAELGAARDVSYSHIPPGEYTFHVTACNRDGEWAEAGASLAFRVLPQFWQTWWFLGLGAVAVVGLLAGGIRLAERRRYQRRLRALEMEGAMEQERARIARDMHDEIGARLTQITIINALTTQRAGDASEVRTQSGKIAVATRELTRSLDEIVWAVRPQNDNLESLVEYLGQATRDLCDGSEVRCWFSTPPEVPAMEVTAPIRHNLVLACREAVNNVLKHSGAAEMRIRIRLEDRQLTVAVSDNGRGFDVAQAELKRSGLVNMRQRMTECGGSCEISSASSGGTDIRFHLPLASRSHAPPNSGNRRPTKDGLV